MKLTHALVLILALTVAGCASSSSMQTVEGGGAAVAVPEAEPEPAASLTIWDGVFTSAQADRGAETAQSVCFACHSRSEWEAPMFMRVWSGRPVHQMWETLRLTMPYDSPGRLSAQEYTDVVAYMLELNGAPAGDEELPSDPDGLMQIAVTPGP